LPGIPISQIRSRSNCFGHHYNPQRKKKLSIQWELKSMYRGEIIKGAVTIFLYFCFPVPKSWPKEKREAALRGEVPHTKKPDLDNLEKFYLDCLSKVIIEDDRMISFGASKKTYSHNPKTVIKIFRGDYVPEVFFANRFNSNDAHSIRYLEAIPDRLPHSPNFQEKTPIKTNILRAPPIHNFCSE
jgi:Holliday junction resolvase RusA-like endonuclease